MQGQQKKTKGKQWSIQYYAERSRLSSWTQLNMDSAAPEGWAVLAPLVAPVLVLMIRIKLKVIFGDKSWAMYEAHLAVFVVSFISSSMGYMLWTKSPRNFSLIIFTL
jgi:hypothetical protein